MGGCPRSEVVGITAAVAKVLDELIRDGAPNVEIADRLFVSAQTIKWHISIGMSVSNTTNRTALALWWIRAGRYEWLASQSEDLS